MRALERGLLTALWAVLSFVFPTIFPTHAYADDSSVGVILPGLRFDPVGSVRVSASSLVSRAGRIELTLNVAVQSGQSGSATIQMPRFGWLGESGPYPDRQFPEVQILVDGVPSTIESSFAAFVGSTDVTEAIGKAGVDPFVISDTPPFVAPKDGRERAHEMLKRLGAVEQFGGACLAKWTAQRKVKVALDPGLLIFTLTYKGLPGYALLSFHQIGKPAYLAKYCLSAPDLVRVFGRVNAARLFAVSDSAIPSSIDDRPPPSLSVVVDAPGKEEAPRSLTAFCGADGKAGVGQATVVRASARTDGKGANHILSVGAAH
jgi:hypothetical protein